MASIKVSASPKITEGKELKGEKKPYGSTTYDETVLTGIKMLCADQHHQNQEYKPDEASKGENAHANCFCKCILTEVIIEVKFTVRYNLKRIEDGWMNPDSKDAHSSKDKKDRDLKLDKKSVEIHEQAHCDYVTEQIRKFLEDKFNKEADGLFAECKCVENQKCKEELIKQLKTRIERIGEDQWKKLTEELDEDYRGSQSEKDAREKQVKYLEEEEKKKKEKRR